MPFCRRLCPYCDFAVAVRRNPPHDAYCDALLDELRVQGHEGLAPRTIYFGGGTPSLWALAALTRFLDRIRLDGAQEVTIEANPHDITPDNLDAWHGLGIDRVSVGVQSFDDEVLRALGRDHGATLAREAIERLVGDGRFRTSLDLIYAGPAYSREILAADLDVVRALAPHHVSAYQLTVEPATVFGRRARQGRLPLPDEDEVADRGQELAAGLAELGYTRYEVSSYGRAGDIGVHNSGYWRGVPYVGLGVGAHGMAVGADGAVTRRRNPRRLREYLRAPGEPEEVERLSARAHLGERLFLATRTTLGVSWAELRARFAAIDPETWGRVEAAVREFTDRGWLAGATADLRATAAGLDFADTMAARLWAATQGV